VAKVLRMSDRIKVKIGELSFELAPLSNDRKIEISSCTKKQDGIDVYDHGSAQHLYVKYSLKKVTGLTDYNDNEYKLSFENEVLTDDCVSEIFMIPQKQDLMAAAWQLLNGMPEKLTDHNGKVMKGVKLEVLTGLNQK
jgi:hypothetical protein